MTYSSSVGVNNSKSLDGLEDEDEIPTLIPVEADRSDVSQELHEKDGRRVPCTLISGFLGAGKTTLLKHLLTSQHGQRIAVIMNEFADTADIEARAINVHYENDESGDLKEAFLELPNGCLCCTVKDLGLAAIENFMKRNGAFDHILLETTGLADPGPIASLFWQNEDFSEGLGRRMFLNGVCCVVDAVFGRQQLEEDHASDGVGESSRQIACADIILLNKVDLAGDENITAIEDIIHSINPTAPIHKTVKGQLQPELVLSLNAYSPTSAIWNDKSNNTFHYHDEHDGHRHHVMPHQISITGVKVDIPVIQSHQVDLLDEWIRIVLWECRLPDHPTEEMEVLRCKGIYSTDKGDFFMVQGVQNLYEIKQLTDEEKNGLPAAGKLVFIGKGLNDNTKTSLLAFLKIRT